MVNYSRSFEISVLHLQSSGKRWPCQWNSRQFWNTLSLESHDTSACNGDHNCERDRGPNARRVRDVWNEEFGCAICTLVCDELESHVQNSQCCKFMLFILCNVCSSKVRFIMSSDFNTFTHYCCRQSVDGFRTLPTNCLDYVLFK